MPPEQIHASCVAIGGKGIVLFGHSGSGKSDLALRLIDEGATLVGDDQVMITLSPRRGETERGALLKDISQKSPHPNPPPEGEGILLASPAPNIHGMIEARGVGILHLPYLRETPLALAVKLTPEETDRLPHPTFWSCLGLQLPLLSLNAFHASTPAKIRLFLSHMG